MNHITRPGKVKRGATLTAEDLDNLPDNIANPLAVLRDTRSENKNMLLYVFNPLNDERRGKIVVQVNYSEKLQIGDAEREMITSNSVRTAGYVSLSDLQSDQDEILHGVLE